MTIAITSTTDTPENVQSAIGHKADAGKAAEGTQAAGTDQSAPASKEGQEQKQAPASDTEAKEAKGETEEADETESETDEGSEAAAKDDKPKKGKGGFQRRIDKLNAQKSAAQQETEYWKNLALQKSAGADKAEKPATTPNQDAKGKPEAGNFETHSEFVEALADWKADQKLNAFEEKQRSKQLETEQQSLVKTYAEREKSFAAKTEDYADVLAEVDDVPLSPTLREILVTSENGPQLAYELAKNRADFERISKLPPIAAARELGKIESRLAAATSEKKPETKTTKAPKPLDPVGSKGASVDKDIYDPNMSQKDYERIRAKQRADAAKAG